MTCQVCKVNPADHRLVRDDYDTVRGTFPLTPTTEQQDRISSMLDRIPESYVVVECKPCMRKYNLEVQAELDDDL